LAFNVGGSGEEKFISVVKDGKYQNTLSAGAVINFFPRSASGFFMPSDAWQTRSIVERHYEIHTRYADAVDVSKDTAFINTAIRSLRAYEQLLRRRFGEYDKSVKRQAQVKDVLVQDSSIVDLIIKGRIARDTLIALGYLKKKYLDIDNIDKRIASIPPGVGVAEIREKKFLTKVETELMNAKWTAFSLQWWTLKPTYNVKPYKMINPTAPDDNFADTYNDKFFSVAMSWNYTRLRTVRRQFQYTVTPTLTLSNGRDFSALTEQTITKTQQIDINGTPVEEVLWSTKGYKEKPERVWSWNAELPLIFFWNKYNLGFEIAGRAGEHNPNKDNFGARVGVYIPIEIKDGNPIWIEPLFKVGKLGNTKKNDKGEEAPLSFWKDNVEVGFNLSVALPNFKVFSKK
jgi:hypothetical protein